MVLLALLGFCRRGASRLGAGLMRLVTLLGRYPALSRDPAVGAWMALEYRPLGRRATPFRRTAHGHAGRTHGALARGLSVVDEPHLQFGVGL